MLQSILRSPQTKSKGAFCGERFASQIRLPENAHMPRRNQGRAIPLSVKKALGGELKRIRMGRGLKLEDVAENVGTDPANIWRLEQGGQVSLDMLFAVCGFFRLPLSELMKSVEGGSGIDPARDLSREAVQIGKMWDALPDPAKSRIEDALIEVATLIRTIPTYFDSAASHRRRSFEDKLKSLPRGIDSKPSKPNMRGPL